MNRYIASLVLAGIAGIASSAQAQTTVLLSDTFADGGRTNGADALDTSWFTTNTAGTGLTASSGSLLFTGGANSAFLGSFAQQQLALVGDSIELSFNFNFTTTPTANGAGFRFGLFNSNGTAVTADNSVADDNDEGYMVTVPTGGGRSFVKKEDGTDNSPLIGSDSVFLGNWASGGILELSAAGLGTAVHEGQLTIARTGTSSVQITLFIDDQALYSIVDSSATGNYLSFNEVAIGLGSVTQGLRVDNVLVTYQTPEPAGLAALGLGALALLRRRRRC